ncbi:unnamed protein product [Cunninghamella echinulata]
MANEKEPLLPIINEKIEANKRDWILDIEVGPCYEDNKWWWFLVTLLRIIIFFASLFFTITCSKYIENYLNIQNDLGFFVYFLYLHIVFLPILLLVSFVFGQFNYFYLFTCRSPIYKHILPREYILNRIATKASLKSSL